MAAPNPVIENQSFQTEYKMTGRYEINEKGQFLLTPDDDSSVSPAPWSGKSPNAMTGSSGPYITSGVLFFVSTGHGRTQQLAGLWGPEITMPVTDILIKAVNDHLKNAFRPE